MPRAFIKPAFVEGKAGRLFCLRAWPGRGKPSQATLIVPPFAEELNKSRHVLARIVRRLADEGHVVALPDLYGTGDSEGDFADASVDMWQSDLECTLSWLGSELPLHIMALRAGSLLLSDVVRTRRVHALTLIQPVTEGKKHLERFLRLGTAASFMGKGRSQSVSDLKLRLAKDEAVEIAGYRVSPELAAGLSRLSLSQLPTGGLGRVHWLELVPSQPNALLPSSQTVIDAWQVAGIRVDAKVLPCPQFWSTQELSSCQRLTDVVADGVEG